VTDPEKKKPAPSGSKLGLGIALGAAIGAALAAQDAKPKDKGD
jgi:hypothetical protein